MISITLPQFRGRSKRSRDMPLLGIFVKLPVILINKSKILKNTSSSVRLSASSGLKFLWEQWPSFKSAFNSSSFEKLRLKMWRLLRSRGGNTLLDVFTDRRPFTKVCVMLWYFVLIHWIIYLFQFLLFVFIFCCEIAPI
jgi:hypothetical protein